MDSDCRKIHFCVPSKLANGCSYIVNPRDSAYPVSSADGACCNYRHLSFRPGEARCRNLIFSASCLSPGGPGLPLRGIRNDGSGAGSCYCQAVCLKRCDRTELSGYPDTWTTKHTVFQVETQRISCYFFAEFGGEKNDCFTAIIPAVMYEVSAFFILSGQRYHPLVTPLLRCDAPVAPHRRGSAHVNEIPHAPKPRRIPTRRIAWAEMPGIAICIRPGLLS